MKRRQVERPERAVQVLKRGESEWRAVELPNAAAAVHRAMSDPVRATIFDLLGEGAIRQIDLARLLTEALGRRFDVSAMRHHLNVMKKAGLIDYEEFPGKQTKRKMIYQAADVELRMRKRPKPEITPAASKNIEEWLAELKKRRMERG